MKRAFIFFVLLPAVVWIRPAAASEQDLEWKHAAALARQGQMDFAFADFDSIARTFPRSRYAMPAEFAVAEYYFLNNQLPEAVKKFEVFVQRWPKSREALAAQAYLYKAAQVRGDAAAMEKYRKELATAQQAKFVFKDTRSFEFASAFGHRHKFVLSIDKIEVTVDAKPLVEVAF